MSDYIYNPDSGELYHYGVLGMRWGVRRTKKYQGKAAGAMASSQKSLEKAKKSNDSWRKNDKKTMSRALEAAESAYSAQRHAERSDKIAAKHERKFQKQVARNEKRIERARRNGVDAETLNKRIEKAKKFVETHDMLTKDVKSLTRQTDEQQRRVHDFVKYMEERTYWRQSLTEKKKS